MSDTVPGLEVPAGEVEVEKESPSIGSGSFSRTGTLGLGLLSLGGASAAGGYGADKLTSTPAIVLDIGSKFIRAGFSHECRPRIVLPNRASYEREFQKGGYDLHGHTKDNVKWKPLWTVDEFSILENERAVKVLEKRLYSSLQYIFQYHLMINPQGHRFVVCEGPLLATSIKKVIEKVLLEDFKGASADFVNSSFLTCLAFGRSSGLVIDIGYLETTIVPIYEGRPMNTLIKYCNLGSRLVSRRLAELVAAASETEDNNNNDSLEDILDIDDSDMMNFIFRETNGSSNRQELLTQAIQDVFFKLGNEDGSTLPKLINQALRRCPLDLRRLMAQNIMLCGGLCLQPETIIKSLSQFLDECCSSSKPTDETSSATPVISNTSAASSDPMSFGRNPLANLKCTILTTNFPRSNVAWIGASLYGRISDSIKSKQSYHQSIIP